MSTIVRIVNYLKSKFAQCEVKILISAINGEIEVSEYEDKILEALKQADIKIEEDR